MTRNSETNKDLSSLVFELYVKLKQKKEQGLVISLNKDSRNIELFYQNISESLAADKTDYDLRTAFAVIGQSNKIFLFLDQAKQEKSIASKSGLALLIGQINQDKLNFSDIDDLQEIEQIITEIDMIQQDEVISAIKDNAESRKLLAIALSEVSRQEAIEQYPKIFAMTQAIKFQDQIDNSVKNLTATCVKYNAESESLIAQKIEKFIDSISELYQSGQYIEDREYFKDAAEFISAIDFAIKQTFGEATTISEKRNIDKLISSCNFERSFAEYRSYLDYHADKEDGIDYKSGFQSRIISDFYEFVQQQKGEEISAQDYISGLFHEPQQEYKITFVEQEKTMSQVDLSKESPDRLSPEFFDKKWSQESVPSAAFAVESNKSEVLSSSNQKDNSRSK